MNLPYCWLVRATNFKYFSEALGLIRLNLSDLHLPEEESMSLLNVSVVIPTYNRATLIARAIDSVLAQVVEGDEVIVVDDGSTDNTEEALSPYLDRIRYIKTGNAGPGAARNRGIKEAHNPLVAFLDSDDEWLPGKMALQRNLMQAQKEIVYCFSDFSAIGRNNDLHHHNLRSWIDDARPWDEILGQGVAYSSIAPLSSGMADFPVHMGNMYFRSLRVGCLAMFTLMVRRERAGAALHCAEDLAIYEDWECFGRLARVGQGAFMDCELAIQHGHSGPRISNRMDMLGRTTCRLKMLARVWGADKDFLLHHGDDYRQVVREQRLHRVAALLRLCDAQAARAEIRQIENCPWTYRMAARLPGPLLRGLISVRSLLAGADRVSAHVGGKFLGKS